MPSGNLPENNNNNPPSEKHDVAIFTLCWVVFTNGYLIMSVCPYVSDTRDHYYDGLILGAFMAGRALTSYAWGQAADLYGRKWVLVTSLWLSMILSLTFGVWSDPVMVLVWRFGFGLVNGMMGTVKTVVAEIAAGNEQAALKGIGRIVWAWAFFNSPTFWVVVGGAFLDLDHYPFFLINTIGALLCATSLVFVHGGLDETLPAVQWRHPQHLPRDVWRQLCRCLLSSTPEASRPAERQSLVSSKDVVSATRTNQATAAAATESDVTTSTGLELPESVLQHGVQKQEQGEDEDHAIRASIVSYHEETPLLVQSMTRRRQSSAVRRPSSSPRQGVAEGNDTKPVPPATVALLWSQKRTRHHMVVYWLGALATVVVEEGLPRFLSLRKGGFASIRLVLYVAGALFVALEYGVYAKLVESFGLYGSMKIASLAMWPSIALLPLVLLLDDKGPLAVPPSSISSSGDTVLESRGSKWAALAFLSVMFAAARIFVFSCLSSLMVALNRTVVPAHRGAMNGLNSLGDTAASVLGTSLLLAVALSSRAGPDWVFHTLLFAILIAVTAATALGVISLRDEDDEDDETDVKSDAN